MISEKSIKYHPRHFEALLKMKKPAIAPELQQFVCAKNWMRNSIPEYSERIKPLDNLLESCYKKSGKRTKRSIRNIPISNSWGTNHYYVFSSIKQQLAAAVKLSYPRPDTFCCLFTVASLTHWSAILTQVKNHDKRVDIKKQNHEPLCFLSGSFIGSSAKWFIPEKEGFAVLLLKQYACWTISLLEG